ncbi:Pantoate-beta-alanine ligase [Mycena metata]|uniref:Pantoate--beta-alanine ligase n=1 Tax=Mycena metata TaxID=1033252 RepID=A0AAD7J791_9AGAR|nr:Pantoate-beta-alanine ligase [Mycena metata]
MNRLSPVMRTMSTSALPPSTIPLLTTVSEFRLWREAARRDNKSVGFVPTMGALHDGHMCLGGIRKSLAENDLTVISIFVNPAQFAPHEDLATYPRTLPRDLETLTAESLSVSGDSTIRKASAIFLPSVREMYPSGIDQDVAAQKGTFLEVKGYGEQMEGKSRPTFFRGVATVVTKLFNAVEPNNAYFGQKDIQQCLILKRLCRDLLLSHPDPAHVHIVPTARDPTDNLALSSRNAYLSAQGRKIAPTLFRALEVAEQAWNDGQPKEICVARATDVVRDVATSAKESDLEVRLDYIEFNDSDSLEALDGARCLEADSRPVILSGALWIGMTRLIDNIVLGDVAKLQ